VNAIYRRFGERWLLEEVFDALLLWNRWWPRHRDVDGFLCWGSEPAEGLFTDGCVNCWQAALYESGLDNSPMYDGVPFDTRTHLLQMADVGLMSLYVTDCNELAEIADTLGRGDNARELRARAARYGESLRSFWHEDAGLFLNRRIDTGEWSHRISPTNFYPLLARVATHAQAKRMIEDHYFNAAEFHGEFVMPSIARNDTAFADQAYWRGRIWGPLNFLVYLGMKNYSLDRAAADLAERSSKLMMKSWLEKGTIHENYNAVTGDGDDRTNSDGFYHWGALLGFIKWMERQS
jgi:neutral trehalase